MRPLFFLLFAASCTGQIWDGTAAPSSTTPAPSTPLPDAGAQPPGPVDSPRRPVVCEGQPQARVARRVRRLTQREYANTVRDLLGETVSMADLPGDGVLGGFRDNAAVNISAGDVEKVQFLARGLASSYAAKLPGALGCDPVKLGDEACAFDFVDRFGLRAFRRPLSDDERNRYRAFYRKTRPTSDLPNTLRIIVQAMLESPHFLYRTELGSGPAAGTVTLAPFELASALSYALTGTMPDAALLKAATENRLSTAAEIEAQAQRLLDGGRGAEALRDFVVQWMGLDELEGAAKSAKLLPASSPWGVNIATAMRLEVQEFVGKIVWAGDASLNGLLTSSSTFVPTALGPIYGRNLSGTTKIDHDPQQRAGLLTLPALPTLLAHADSTSPVHRGKFVATKLFCFPLPPPPPEANMAATKPGLTERQLSDVRRSDGLCAGCHNLIDPLGFAFEHYDAVGRYRAKEADGTPIDARGDLRVSGDVDGMFDGVLGLNAKLLNSDQFKACFASHFQRYVTGRGDRADCAVTEARDRFLRTGNLRELVLALVTSADFRERATQP